MNFLLWIDRNPLHYWSVLGFLLLVCTGLALLHLKPREEKWWRIIGHDAWFILALSLLVFAGRWPFLFFPLCINPDEATFIAAMLTAGHDPVFFRSISTGTSGPLNTYVLGLAWLIGLPLDYFSSRLLGLLTICGTLAFLYLAAKEMIGALFARILILPLAVFYTLTLCLDYAHFSSEHLPVMMLSGSLYLLARYFRRREASLRFLILFGLLCGSIPFSKLQSTPTALVIGLSVVTLVLLEPKPWKQRLLRCGVLCLSAVVPFAVLLTTTLATGCAEYFIRTYFLENVLYTKSTGVSPMQNLAFFGNFLAIGERLAHWIYLQMALAILVFTAAFWRAVRRRPDRAEWAVLAFVLMLLFVGLYSVVAPGRFYPHYLLFLVVPVASMAIFSLFFLQRRMTALPEKGKRAVTWAILVLWSVGGVVLQLTISPPPEWNNRPLGRLQIHRAAPMDPRGAAVARLGYQGQGLAVWGWMNELYVESQMWSATRDGVLQHSLWGGTNTFRYSAEYLEQVDDYYERLYMEDLEKNRPSVFVDGVASRGIIFRDRSLFGYETFPALARYVDQNYKLVEEVFGVRIFVRNDLAP